MATRRRQPQALPQTPLTQVTAAPVSTFVDPGQGGAPAQPVLAPAPTPPAQNQYQDLNNLAQAFGGLSQSLADIGRAQLAEEQQAFRQQQFDKQNRKEREADSRRRAAAIKEREREARRLKDRAEMLERSKKADERAAAADLRRQIALIEDQLSKSVIYEQGSNPAEYMQQVGGQLTVLHEQGLINLDELPLRRAASAFAASQSVGQTKVDFTTQLNEAINKNPKLSTFEGFRDFYNDYTESLKQDLSKYPDPAAAASAIDTARNRQFQAFRKSWRDETSKRLVKQQTSEVGETVLSFLDDAYDAWSNAAKPQIKDFSYAKAAFQVEGVLDDATVANRRIRVLREKAEELASSIDNIIKVGTMSASSVNKLVGEEIINRLKKSGEPDYEKAKFIRQFLNYAVVGPEGNRARLLGDGKGETFKYYKDNEAEWEARIVSEATAAKKAAAEAAKVAHIDRRNSFIDNTLGNFVEEQIDDGFYTASTIVGRLQQTVEEAAGFSYDIRGGGEDTELVFPSEKGAPEKKVKLSTLIKNALANRFQANAQAQSELISKSISSGADTYAFIKDFGSPEEQKYAIDILGKARAAAQMPAYVEGDEALFDFFQKTIVEQNQNPKKVDRNRANLRLAISALKEFAEHDTNNVFTKRVLGKNYNLMKVVYDLATSDEPILRMYGNDVYLQTQLSKDTFGNPEVIQEAREGNNSAVEAIIDNLRPKLRLFSDQNAVARVVKERLHHFAVLTGFDSSNREDLETLTRAAEAFVNTIGNDSVNVGDISLYNTDVPKHLLTGNDQRLAVSPEEAAKKTVFNEPYPDRMTLSSALTRAQQYIQNIVTPPLIGGPRPDPAALNLIAEIRKMVPIENGTYFEPMPGSEGSEYLLRYRGPLGQYATAERLFTLEEVATLARAQPTAREIKDEQDKRERTAVGYALRALTNLGGYEDQVFINQITDKEDVYAKSVPAFNTEGIKDKKLIERIDQLRQFYAGALKTHDGDLNDTEELERVGSLLSKYEAAAQEINPNFATEQKVIEAVKQTVSPAPQKSKSQEKSKSPKAPKTAKDLIRKIIDFSSTTLPGETAQELIDRIMMGGDE